MPRHRSLWLVALTKTTAAYTCAAPGGTVAELVHALTEGPYDKAVRPSRAVLAAAAPDAAAYARAMRGANVSDELIYLAASLSSISELDETAETFDATGVFSYRWRDARLAFANLSAGGCFDAVDLSPDQFARLWHPDLHWANQIATGRAQPETRYAPAATLASDGTVTATTATTGTFTCELDHGRLPFDTQACALTAGRRLGRAGERFVVDGASLVLEPTVESLYWRFARTSARLEHGFAQLEFVVKRRRYYFFTNVFAPVTAFVVIAGSSFVVDRYASSARVGLCALSLLIMISQIQYRVKIPDVPRPIWLNAYLGGSIYFIMACLLEYSLVSFHVARERSAAARGAAYLAKLLADLRRHHEPRAPRSRSVANVALATPRHARDDGGDGDAPSPSRDEELADLVGRLSSAQLAPARVTFDAHAKGGELGVGDVKRALVDFGIYFSRAQTDRAVRIVVPASKANRVLDFEGDECDGDDAPAKVRTFATFVLVLSAIEGHQQRAFSETSTSFADEPRSKQIDEVAFACYFPAYLVFLAIMFARIDSYSG